MVNKIFIGSSCQLCISFFGVFPGFFDRIVLILIWFDDVTNSTREVGPNGHLQAAPGVNGIKKVCSILMP